MPLGEWDMNASGRASRASNMSTASRGSKGPGPASDADLAFTAPGVASMLRNSTEMGNLGGLTMSDSFGVPNGPRGPRRGATSRLSTASSHSNHSNRMSMHRAWPSQTSNATRRSRENNVPQYMEDNMPQYLPDTLSPTTVNISGSSPLIPVRVRDPRDSHRSRSMTMANESEPTFRLSANRSLVSLRSNEQNAYRYPTRLRRPGFRPNSPALSDSAGAYAQRGHGHGSQSVPPHPGAARLRMPSDVSIRRDERRALNAGPPDRSRTPVYFGDPHPDIPPVPPLVPQRYHAVEPVGKSQKSYRSASYRSGKASVSSGSTSRRTDSDAPSSDATSPPTPKDGLSMDGFGSPTGTQPLMRSISGVMKNGGTSRPEYYDYTEHFETEQLIEPEASAVPVGYVHRMKGILEERGTPEPITKKVDAFEEVAESVATVGPDIVELPASPVPRRLTKALVRSVLGCATPTDGIESYGASTEAKSCHEASSNDEEPSVDEAKEDRAISCLQPPEVSSNRHSILSQTGSSIMDSSTLEFAVRYSIPMVAGNGITMATDDTGDATGPAAEPTTEDGMSDLLDGYQHTDTKQEIEPAAEEDIVADDRAEKTSNHAAKSSNEQSFKSCTDLPELTEHPVKGMDVKALESCEDLPEPDPPFKDSDAKSFKTCKDAVTPETIVSMLDSRLPLSRLAASEPKFNRPTSEMPCSSPLSSDGKLPPPSDSESSMTRLSNRIRTNSKPGSKHGSAAASVSSSIGSGPIQPPRVPPRESSSSKEAQRSSAVAGFLMRQIRPRLAKATSSLNRKPAKKEAKQEEENTSQNIPTPPPMRERPISNNANSPIKQPSEAVKMPELVSIKQEPALAKKTEHNNLSGDSWTSRERTPLQFPALKSTPIVQLRPSGTPSPMLAEPSSVYSPGVSSPENNSFSTSHVQPSPVTFLQSPEGNRRDNQTTTHLSWPGQKPLVLRSVNGGEECIAQGTSLDETTTTDLRPATYQKYPTNYLPDLKEESHEDSSLNTSASNLKHSSFRFPGAGQPDLRVSRMSIDDAAVYGRSPSTKSYRQSRLAKTCGLPSMNFSVMDLADKFGDIFEHRGSRSLELSPHMREGLLQLDQHRPASAGGVPAKYQSGLADLDTSNGMASALSDMFPKKRSFSPQALKDEVDNLNVPSVDALTLRFSELMPSLREDFQEDCKPGDTGEFAEEEKIMEHALEEIKEVSKPAPKQSIARLRAVPGSSSVVVVYDDFFKEQQQEKRPKSAKELGEIGATKGRSWSVAHTRARDKTVLAELEAPSPTAVRSRSLSLGHQELGLSSESPLSSRSVRSLESTPTETVTDTRPWNRDENYPWATTESVEIDISLPRSAAAKSSPRPGPSNLRHRLSEASSASSTSGPDGTPGSPTSPVGTMPMPGSDDPYTHARRQSIQRWSLFGMPSKQAVNPPASIDASGFATGPVRVRDEDQSHGAESTSRFSNYTTDDDAAPSSSRKGRLVKKKGRNKKAAVNRAKSSRVQEIPQLASTNESTSSEGGTTEVQPRENRRTFSGAEGMSRWTYYSSKFVDKVKGLYDSVRRLGRRSRKSDDEGAQIALTPF